MRSLSQARLILGDLPNQAPGIFIEDKGVSLAVHFREASPAAERKARSWLRRITAQFREHLHIIRASNVWELLPREIRGKGFALRGILRGLRRPFLPFYVGDDLTDEEAFAALGTGVTVLAGPLRRTKRVSICAAQVKSAPFLSDWRPNYRENRRASVRRYLTLFLHFLKPG